ncbi:PKD domain-containing protein [Saccharicrinis sp. FJH62]|uniref:PKD domain-containing protein n=1 Tax=Saccharicrinis sp. FJH62 TaxID=3344657 RepID=UPI0035D528C4
MHRLYLIIILSLIALLKVSGQINFNAFMYNDQETVKFINLTQHESSDPYMLFYWKLGDGNEGFAGSELIHFYEAAGMYKVTLIGIKKSGIRDTFQQEFKIPGGLELLSEETEIKKRSIAQDLSNLKQIDLIKEENNETDL